MYYDNAIEVANLSKVYKIYSNPKDRLKQFIFGGDKNYYTEFWALRNVTFNVEKGKTVGIIGKNGSGKSTLLQIITQTLQSSEGKLKVEGRISALLELGSGFNPEYTGRENVYMNGSIMGLSEKEIKAKMSEIEEFAEIGEFIDQPVKLYSSGMFVRLAFACAINVDPDILIVDEALAVGDMQFQLKCIDKMKQFKEEGKTILFVSHDTYSIKNFCDEVIWLKDGQVFKQGDVLSITNEYEEFMKSKVYKPISTTAREDLQPKEAENDSELNKPRNEVLSIDGIRLTDKEGVEKKEFQLKEDLIVNIDYTVYKSIGKIVAGIAIIDQQDQYICGINTKLDNYLLDSKPGKHTLKCRYKDILLLPGIFSVDIGFFENSGMVRLDYKSKYAFFRMLSAEYIAEGVTYLEHEWTYEEEY